MKNDRIRANFDTETAANKQYWEDNLSALWSAVVDTADIAFTALMLGNSEEIYEGVSGKEVGSLTERNQMAKGVAQSATDAFNYAGQVLSGNKSPIEMGTDLYEAGKSGAKNLYSDFVEPFVKDAEYMWDDTVKGGMWTRSIEESYEKGSNQGKRDLAIAELLLSRGAGSAYKQGVKKAIDLPDGDGQRGKRDGGNRTGLLLDGVDNNRNSSASLKGGKLKTQAKSFPKSIEELQKEVDKLLKQMGNVFGGVAVFRDAHSGEYRFYFVRHDDLPGNGGGGGGNHRRRDGKEDREREERDRREREERERREREERDRREREERERREREEKERREQEQRDTEGTGEAKLDDTIEKGKKITNFDNPADPFRDVLGAGSKSHPEEWNKLIKDLEENGVEVVYREGGLGYGPLRKGEAGQVLLDPNASMSALRHEYSHFLEAKANGFPSAAESYQNWEGRIADELKAYTIEIKEAKRLGLDNVVEQLQKNFEDEKQYIIDRFKPIDE
ncbi:hypothetical protein ACFU8X_29180 [Brevibacillus porteri]|uniref:hypothetical protein n=1 Tax=Brevibacillus porteri TaxID=2126350 RepID=UPI003709E6F9